MDKRRSIAQSKKLNIALIIIMALLSINILIKSFEIYAPEHIKVSTFEIYRGISDYFSEKIFVQAVPLLSYTFNNQENLDKQQQLKGYESGYFSTFISNAFPLIDYVLKQESTDYHTVAEIYPRIEASHQQGVLIDDLEQLKNLPEDEGNKTIPVEDQQPKTYIYTMNQLQNFDFLIKNLYAVDGTIKVTEDLFPVERFLEKNVSINIEEEGPKVLIFHTHSQEDFIDSRPGVVEDTVVGLGRELKKILENEYGVEVLHHEGVYDLVNGINDRSRAYSYAEKPIAKILEEHPSIELVIDLHRDGVKEHMHLVTEIEGQQTAQIMFFNGICKTLSNGKIVDYYLSNPYLEDNMALSFQMQLKAAELYPGFSRYIYLKGPRFNMHLAPNFLFVEVGAQTNTVEEAKNAMPPLAKIIYEVIK